MAEKRKDILILSEEQREAITGSSARLEIIDTIFGLAPCSIAELAEELQRSPQSLYYHINILVDCGLLKQVGTRKSGKRDEAIYDLAAQHLRLTPGRDDEKAYRRAMLRFNSTIIRLTERNYREAFDQKLVRTVNKKRQNIYTRRQRAWLTDEDIEKVYKHIDAIGEILLRGNKRRTGQAFAMTTVLAPLTEPRETPNGAEDDDDRG
ncbi:MAG: helix-turn-helix domain-containing protein [Phycisphaerales bacterium]